jgi:hypothetical protein
MVAGGYLYYYLPLLQLIILLVCTAGTLYRFSRKIVA